MPNTKKTHKSIAKRSPFIINHSCVKMPKPVTTEVSSRKWKILENQIETYCTQQKKIICKWLDRRSVFLDMFLECSLSRKDKNHRMQFFFCAIELLRTATIYHTQILQRRRCFEFQGVTPNGKEFGGACTRRNHLKRPKTLPYLYFWNIKFET